MAILTKFTSGTSGPDAQDTLNFQQAQTNDIAPYIGLVSNGNYACVQTVSGNSINGVTIRYARTAISGQGKVRLPWFYLVNTGWETGSGMGAMTDRAVTIEYPVGSGQLTNVSFSALAPAGGFVWSDTFTWPDIPEGAMFGVRAWATTSGGNVPIINRGSSSGFQIGLGAGVTAGNGQANQTGNAAFAPANAHFWWGPDLMVATTTKRTFLLFADSREQDLANQADRSMDFGLVGRSLGQSLAFVSFAINGGNMGATDGSRQASRAAMYDAAAYVTDVINCMGYNDRSNVATAMGGYATNFFTDVKAVKPSVLTGQCTIFGGVGGPTVAGGGGLLASLTSSGTTATATLADTAGQATGSQKAAQLWIGQPITIAGATPAGYNGDVVVTGISGAAVTYTLLAGASGLAAASPAGALSDKYMSPIPVFQNPAINLANLVGFNTDTRRGRAGQDYFIEIADRIDLFRDAQRLKPGLVYDGVHLSYPAQLQLRGEGIVQNQIPSLRR